MTDNQPEIDARQVAADLENPAVSETPEDSSASPVTASEDAREAGAETVEAGGGDEGRLPRAVAHEDTETDDEGDLEDDSESESSETQEERLKRLEEEGDIAADYLEELLDIADLDGDIDIDVDGDRASVEIRGATQLEKLNAPKGELMDSLQELARLAVQTRTGNRSRLMLDIGGFRAEHRTDLEGLAEKAIAEALDGGQPVPMRPMNPFERKVVHDVVKRAGLRSESDGDGKNRHVVIYPGS